MLTLLILVYKCIHKEEPKYIEEDFKFKICNYNLRGLGTLLTLPSFNLEWRHKSFSFLAAKLRNSLSTYVRYAKDIFTFKCLSRTFARKLSNIDFFLRLLPVKVDELLMSEMSKKWGVTDFVQERTSLKNHPKSEKSGFVGE